MDSLNVAKSVTLKPKNEDYIDKFSNKDIGIRGFILGDGIGSHYKSEEGSRFCVLKMKEYLEECKLLSDLDIHTFYRRTYQALKNKYSNFSEDGIQIIPQQAFGTTLICVIEFNDKFIISYLGNGSIWHIRGNFADFNPQRYLSWNAINILNPHTIDVDGKDVLYKFIALESSEDQIKPTILTIEKDNELFGDILMASTDGLYSIDHNPIAKDRDGDLWISGDKKMEIFLNQLGGFLKKDLLEPELDNNMNEYLDTVKQNNLIDDDLTFGIIVTSRALYQLDDKL